MVARGISEAAAQGAEAEPAAWPAGAGGMVGTVGTGGTGGARAATVISAGTDHSCAVTSTGGVKCWGANSTGELGDGTTMERHTPVDVVGLSAGVSSVVAAFGYSC